MAGRRGRFEDKFGASRQVTSPLIEPFIGDSDHVGAKAATQAMISVSKIDLDLPLFLCLRQVAARWPLICARLRYCQLIQLLDFEVARCGEERQL